MHVPPNRMGLPDKFTAWRQGQFEAMDQSIESRKRFIAHCMPTGGGKTLLYMAEAILMQKRACVLTATKALQAQILEDFKESGLVDVRGQGNYPCILLKDTPGPAWTKTVEWGPCHVGENCDFKKFGCHYFDAVRIAKEAPLVVTNYSYWLASHYYGEGLGEFDMLICDEAHSAPDQICDFLHIDLEASELDATLGIELPRFPEIEEWKKWAAVHAFNCESEAKKAKKSGQRKRARQILRLGAKMEALTRMTGEWIIERRRRSVAFDPVWPQPYRELLMQNIPKVILASATIRPKTCEYLGIAPGEVDFFEYPSSFPVARRPVIHIPTIRVDYRATDQMMQEWVTRIDQIISRRLDRKGIIHTVSYARRDFLLQRSRHKDILVSHRRDNTEEVVGRFKEMPPPAVLVSPSVGTGYDFPYTECEYSIIGKLPYPDTRPPIMKARSNKKTGDFSYPSYLAAQELVQAAGRGMRAADDQHEVFITDDNIIWFKTAYGDFVPQWFWDAYRSSRMVPDPPDKLEDVEMSR